MLLEKKMVFPISKNLFRKEMVKSVTHITVNGPRKTEKKEEERGKPQDFGIKGNFCFGGQYFVLIQLGFS